MYHIRLIRNVVLASLLGLGSLSCGGSQPNPENADEGDENYLTDIVGEVDEDAEIDDDGSDSEEKAYTGPTALTVNLKVVNTKNPDGSFRLLDADGKVVIDKGALGEPTEVKQGSYTLEFKSPLVFGDPVYRVEDVTVEGEEMTVDEVFPAGQVTLHTFRKNPKSKCKPVSFSVRFETGEKDLPGKGRTCKPIILEAGSYELLLDISKRKVQPVKMQVNPEQVSSSSLKLDQ